VPWREYLRGPRLGHAGLAALLLGIAAAAFAHEGEPSSSARLFEPPPPGSYELPVIAQVGDHWLLDSSGERNRLLGLGAGQVGFVSFVSGSCAEACPLAFAVLQRFDRELASLPGLASRVRLVTVSFDPDRDTPARMGEFRRHFAPAGDWRFLTAPDVQRIEPVIGDFGQDVLRSSTDSRVVEHVLKVFLVDSDGGIRNVYSAGFLDVEILRNDAATVLGLAPASWSGEPEAR
jgi:cytochrome oxidase Cu insertion factor (SCO1/SenC/PrrC family)